MSWTRLETQDAINSALKGQEIEKVEHDDGYADIRFYFKSGLILDIEAQECFDFIVEIQEGEMK